MNIKNEMLALIGGCTSEGTKILIPENLKNEFKKITMAKFDIFTDDTTDNYDLIIQNEPGDIANIYKKLSKTGIYITIPKSLTHRDLFAKLSKLFWIVIPGFYLDENLTAKPFVFASKKFHPQADIIRHRSDFVENAEYYTTDIQISAFNLPKYIFEEIKDVIKI